MKILKRDIDPATVDQSKICNNVCLVEREDGTWDLAQDYKMVNIFDYYWDRGVTVKAILRAGGRRNPKLQDNDL